MKNNNAGSITFTTISALALWEGEITGQLSDGMWENSRPYEHWRFWCDLNPSVGEQNSVKSDVSYRCRKNRYGLTRLLKIDCIQNRMLRMAQMAVALNRCPSYRERVQAECLPLTFGEYRAMCDHERHQKKFSHITSEMARKYYDTEYTLKDLRDDLKIIREAMHSVLLCR